MQFRWQPPVNTKSGTRVFARLATGNSIEIEWYKTIKTESKVKKTKAKARLYANTLSLFSISDEELEAFVTIEYTIREAPLNSVIVQLPAEAQILEVNSTGLKSEYSKPIRKGKLQELVLSYEYPISGFHELVINYRLKIPSKTKTVRLPFVQTKGVQRETGYAAVEITSNLGIDPLESKMVQPIDVLELPRGLTKGLTHPIILAYKYLDKTDQTEVKLNIKKHKSIPSIPATISAAQILSHLNKGGELQSQAIFHVRNYDKQFMTISLPPGSRIDSAHLNRVPISCSRKGDKFLLPLSRSANFAGQAAKFALTLVWTTNLKTPMDGRGQLNLPLPNFDIQISKVGWTLFLPSEYDYSDFKSNFLQTGYGRVSLAETISDITLRGTLGKDKGAPKEDRIIVNKKNVAQTFKVIIKKATTKRQSLGKLSVQIKIPQKGKRFSFSKVYLDKNDQNVFLNAKSRVAMQLDYGKPGLLLFLKCLLLLLGMALLFFMHRFLSIRRDNFKRQIKNKKSLVWISILALTFIGCGIIWGAWVLTILYGIILAELLYQLFPLIKRLLAHGQVKIETP